MNPDAGDEPAVKFPEFSAISGAEDVTGRNNRRGKNDPILLGKAIAMDSVDGRRDGRYLQPGDQLAECRQVRGSLGDEVATGLLDHIPVRPSFLAYVKKSSNERPNSAVALRCREENVGR